MSQRSPQMVELQWGKTGEWLWDRDNKRSMMSFWERHKDDLPFGDSHECSGHIHSPHPLTVVCHCGKSHTHPFYVDTPSGWKDCPKVPHETPAQVVNEMSAPTKKDKAKKSSELYWVSGVVLGFTHGLLLVQIDEFVQIAATHKFEWKNFARFGYMKHPNTSKIAKEKMNMGTSEKTFYTFLTLLTILTVLAVVFIALLMINA